MRIPVGSGATGNARQPCCTLLLRRDRRRPGPGTGESRWRKHRPESPGQAHRDPANAAKLAIIVRFPARVKERAPAGKKRLGGRDLHPQECARAGRTKKSPDQGSGLNPPKEEVVEETGLTIRQTMLQCKRMVPSPTNVLLRSANYLIQLETFKMEDIHGLNQNGQEKIF